VEALAMGDPSRPIPRVDKPRSKVTAYFLLLFLGLIGGHKFYLKKSGMGFLYLITLGLGSIGCIVDLFTLGKQVDAFNAALKEEMLPAELQH
jgi:TM2 domain-containing membrane protein YozV